MESKNFYDWWQTEVHGNFIQNKELETIINKEKIMKTYRLKIENGKHFFKNVNNNLDKISVTSLKMMGTTISGHRKSYKNINGYFEDCNCFVEYRSRLDFYKLSQCGEFLTTK